MLPKRVGFIRYKDIDILHINWTGARANEIVQAMNEAKQVIASRPPGSVLTLTTVQDAQMDRTVTEALKGYVEHNKPYVRAGAVVGLNELKMIAFNFVNRVTGRTLRAMDSVDAAKEWLASQAK